MIADAGAQRRVITPDRAPLVVGGALRSTYDLIATAPEPTVVGTVGNAAVILGGGQAQNYGVTLDGLSVMTNHSQLNQSQEVAYMEPSVEALTEFAVDTSGFKAEYGQGGGGMITFASKSGTNDFLSPRLRLYACDALAFDDRKELIRFDVF